MLRTDRRPTPPTLVSGGPGLADLTEALDAHTQVVGRDAYNCCPETPAVPELAVRIRLALAGIFAVIGGLFVLLGVTVSPVALGVAVPFGIAAAVLWQQALQTPSRTDHRDATRQHRVREGSRQESAGRGPIPDEPELSQARARSILGVDSEASQADIKRAYRERVKDAHPDRGGDPDRFREIRQAYDRLSEDEDRAREGF